MLSILEDDVESVDDTWEVTKNCQEDVDPEVTVVGEQKEREKESVSVEDEGRKQSWRRVFAAKKKFDGIEDTYAPQPRSRKTPRGGRKIARMILTMSEQVKGMLGESLCCVEAVDTKVVDGGRDWRRIGDGVRWLI